MISFIIVEFPFHAEKKKFIDWRLRKSVFSSNIEKFLAVGLEVFNIISNLLKNISMQEFSDAETTTARKKQKIRLWLIGNSYFGLKTQLLKNIQLMIAFLKEPC